MHLKIKITTLIIVILIISLALFWFTKTSEISDYKECISLEKRIEEKIQKANYCEKDEDCTIIKFYDCSFGCYGLINNKELDNIKSSLEEYYNKCSHKTLLCKCSGIPKKIECKNGVCIPKILKKPKVKAFLDCKNKKSI